MKLLQERGELPEDFTVAVEVRDDLSKDDTLRIATVENLQLQNLSLLEEAVALTKLVHSGTTLDGVAAQTGLSATTIKRRLALNNLCKNAKQALAKGQINLAQAEALTLGSDERNSGSWSNCRNAITAPTTVRLLLSPSSRPRNTPALSRPMNISSAEMRVHPLHTTDRVADDVVYNVTDDGLKLLDATPDTVFRTADAATLADSSLQLGSFLTVRPSIRPIFFMLRRLRAMIPS